MHLHQALLATASLAFVTCSSGPSSPFSNGSDGLDAGDSGISLASNACSTDGSDRIAAGTYVERFSSGTYYVQMFVPGPTCAFCPGNSPDFTFNSIGLKWRSSWNLDHSKILLTIVHADGSLGSSGSTWFAADGSVYYQSQVTPIPREQDPHLTCDGHAM
jgi:hypothetical protein